MPVTPATMEQVFVDESDAWRDLNEELSSHVLNVIVRVTIQDLASKYATRHALAHLERMRRARIAEYQRTKEIISQGTKEGFNEDE